MLLFQTSREIKFYFQHFIQVCFYFLGEKKWGEAMAPPAPPLATALLPHIIWIRVRTNIHPWHLLEII